MGVYPSKHNQFSGTTYDEVIKYARKEYHRIQKKTPRRVTYVKSRYFTKDKIFINNFWDHMDQKSPKERTKRLKLYACAIDLLRNNTDAPDTIYANVDKNIGLHRFYGRTRAGKYFCVQVKENKRTGRKDFISVFPINKPK